MRDLVVTCVLKLALIPHAPATAEVSAGISALALLGVAHRHSVPEDALVAAGTDTARKVAAELALGDFGPALDDMPARALVVCEGIALGFVSLHAVGHPGSLSVFWGHRKLGLKVKPIGPKWQGLRAVPVNGLADDDGGGVCVIIGGVVVHLQFDDLANRGHQLSDQWPAKGCEPLSAQAESFGRLRHVLHQFGHELANAGVKRLVGDDEDHASFVTEGVQDFEVSLHCGQDVLGGPAKLRWQVLGDVQAHGAVAWERLSVPEVGPAVHRALGA